MTGGGNEGPGPGGLGFFRLGETGTRFRGAGGFRAGNGRDRGVKMPVDGVKRAVVRPFSLPGILVLETVIAR